MRFTLDDKHIIKWTMWKNVEKRILKMFLTEDKVLMEMTTLLKISVRDL